MIRSRGIQPSNRTIVGIAVVLAAAVLLASGIHHVVRIGTCSSTGYGPDGPVAVCPGGVGAWFGFTAGGIVLIVAGAVIAGAGGPVVGLALFMSIGVGSLTVAFDGTAPSGTKLFAQYFGIGFVALGLLGLLLAVWISLRTRVVPET